MQVTAAAVEFQREPPPLFNYLTCNLSSIINTAVTIMKKFNLKKALSGELVVTRDKRAVILTGADICSSWNGGFVLQGIVYTLEGMKRHFWTIEGRWQSVGVHDLDLFML